MQGACGRMDGTGQRRPIYVVVQTYLQFSSIVNGNRLSQELDLSPLLKSNCMWGDSVPNGSLQWSISCLVWFHGDSDMVPWSQLRKPCLGWMRTDLTSEFTHFNLVIRSSNVKQSAFPFSTFCNVSPLLLSLRHLGTFIFTQVKPIQTARNLFLSWCSCFWCNMQHDRWTRRVHTFQVWRFFSFDGFLVRLKISCI